MQLVTGSPVLRFETGTSGPISLPDKALWSQIIKEKTVCWTNSQLISFFCLSFHLLTPLYSLADKKGSRNRPYMFGFKQPMCIRSSAQPEQAAANWCSFLSDFPGIPSCSVILPMLRRLTRNFCINKNLSRWLDSDGRLCGFRNQVLPSANLL